MFDPCRLLSYEFFPVELPPCFQSVSLANKYQQFIANASSITTPSIPLTYSGYKSETSRRKFAIPNPCQYSRAVSIIAANEVELQKVFSSSAYSLTAPIDRKPLAEQPYAKRSNSIADTKREIECLYQNHRFEIRLDINSFFDSIYTHSIAWALHGIEVAKKQRNDKKLIGNQLDNCIQALNYGQTNGLLIGNAVSRIISEIILCTVDKELHKAFPHISCCSFVDDYYIYTSDSAEIQKIISTVRVCLSKYQLNFNENKLQINESPFLYGKPYFDYIKQYLHLPPDAFLTHLILNYRDYKDIAIIKYGLRILSQHHYTLKEWSTMQSRLLNLWVRFPSMADRILEILLSNRAHLKIDPLKKAIYSIIDESLMLNREQELIWAVWYLKVFDIAPSIKYIIKVLRCSTDLAIIIMLDIIHKHQRSEHPDIQKTYKTICKKISDSVNDDTPDASPLWTSHWLLVYEAERNNWLQLSEGSSTYIQRAPFFRKIHSLHVCFYDSNFAYNVSEGYSGGLKFVTQRELLRIITKLQKMLSDRIKSVNSSVENGNKLTDRESKLFEEYVHMFEETERIY